MNDSHFSFAQVIRRELPGVAGLALVLAVLGLFFFWVFELLTNSARVCAAW